MQIINGKKCYYDNYLKSNMDLMKRQIKKDDDVVLIVDGKERIGKSVLAMQMGWYLTEGQMTLDNITLTPEEFEEKVKKANKGEVIIFDEAYLGLSSRDSMMKHSKRINKILVMVGQKNLFIILVLPSFFDLLKYAVLHRGEALIHVFKSKGQRGFFQFFADNKMTKLYIHGKKFYSYGWPTSTFKGRFTNTYLLDEEKYRAKKQDSLIKFLETSKEVGVRKSRLPIEVFYRSIGTIKHFSNGENQTQLANAIGVNQTTISEALKWCRENEFSKELGVTLGINDILNVSERHGHKKRQG